MLEEDFRREVLGAKERFHVEKQNLQAARAVNDKSPKTLSSRLRHNTVEVEEFGAVVVHYLLFL